MVSLAFGAARSYTLPPSPSTPLGLISARGGKENSELLQKHPQFGAGAYAPGTLDFDIN